MSYLLIRNNGLAPIQAFTVLGLSTARGEAEKIGQFGSGSKHGILTIMRAGISFVILIGNDELKFYTVEAEMNGKPYKEVRYRWQGEDHKTGMCLEFGALDWDNVRMSLREFICNALDQGENINDCASVCENIDVKDGETRIFIQMTPPVREYWENIKTHFLHFDRLERTEILPARVGAAQFYRRGVYVTETAMDKEPAMFCYNFQDGKIDECRNLDGAAVGGIAAKLLIKCRASMEQIFRSFSEGVKRWEHNLGGPLWINCHVEHRPAVLAAWQTVFGELAFVDNAQSRERLARKGVVAAIVPFGWSSLLSVSGVVSGETLLSRLDKVGGIECEATPTAIETFRRCWGWIESVRLTQDKPFPEVRCFSMPMSCGAEVSGYYRNGIVYLNLDHDTNEQTALEELAHYITGAMDETRDFQDFAFKLATRLAKRSPITT